MGVKDSTIPGPLKGPISIVTPELSIAFISKESGLMVLAKLMPVTCASELNVPGAVYLRNFPDATVVPALPNPEVSVVEAVHPTGKAISENEPGTAELTGAISTLFNQS
jgi:hypothetical protein